MIVGIGIDTVEVKRIRQLLEEYGSRFEGKIFAPAELEYGRTLADPANELAARFAAKEAVLKALGTGYNHGVKWKEIWVEREPEGPPELKFSGRVAELCQQAGVNKAHVSLTHDGGIATAMVVLESV